VRELTMASKSQQREWLALLDDPQTYCPKGRNLKAWLCGGTTVPVKYALFDTEGMGGIVSDLFGEDRYFAQADAFWTAQNAVIAERRDAYLEAGWRDVVVVSPDEHFQRWEHEKAPKRKGGRVYIEVKHSGEVVFHEGYVTAKEARRLVKGEGVGQVVKAVRPEISGTMQTYIDLHRHAALRAALIGHPGLALRLMVAHAIAGSPLWSVRPESQSTRNDAIRESVENCRGEAYFDEARREALALMDHNPEDKTVVYGTSLHASSNLAVAFARLATLDDTAVMAVLSVVMGETLAAGSAMIEQLGQHIGLDMAPYWQADDAFWRRCATAMCCCP
jgi:ParB family chromosome partitioning protein